MRVVVTGGAGFIGANFVHLALKERPDWTIIVIDKLTYAGNKDSLPDSGYEFYKLDIAIQNQELEQVIKSCDAIVHFAAESHNDNSLESPWPFIESNIIGTFRLLELARKHHKRFHHVSTDEVYGDLELDSSDKFTETTPYKPSSPYSSSKACSDMLVLAWIRSYGLDATISNCSNNYGPRQHVEKFIPRQITEILQGRQPRLYGSGLQVRDWIHVDDHNSAVIKILESSTMGEYYLIGANGEQTNMQVVKKLLKSLGKSEDDFVHVEDRAGHDLRYAIDSTKLQTTLGWRPRYSDFDAGLEQTIEWYRNNQEWWEDAKRVTENNYLKKGH